MPTRNCLNVAVPLFDADNRSEFPAPRSRRASCETRKYAREMTLVCKAASQGNVSN